MYLCGVVNFVKFKNENMTSTLKNPKNTAEMPKGVLTFAQIKDIVGDGFAIIKNPNYEGSMLTGELLYYGSDKDDVYQPERCAGEKHVALRYCGERDPNVVYLL